MCNLKMFFHLFSVLALSNFALFSSSNRIFFQNSESFYILLTIFRCRNLFYFSFLTSKDSFPVECSTITSPIKSKTFLLAGIIETSYFPFSACVAKDCDLNSFIFCSVLFLTFYHQN